MILSDLSLEFLSPTINLFMYPKDFLKFANNLKYYLSREIELIQVKTSKNYPVGILGDIEIHFMHYSSFELAKSKWIERSKRVQFDNIFLLMTDRDGCTYEDIVNFNQLPYEKIIFTNKPHPDIESAFYVKGFEKESSVGILSKKKNLLGMRYLDTFDYVKFLNKDMKR